MSYVLIMGQY